jgi:hypothetical protein
MQRLEIGSSHTDDDEADAPYNGEARESAASRHALAAASGDVVANNPVRDKPTQYPRRPCLVHRRVRPGRASTNNDQLARI